MDAYTEIKSLGKGYFGEALLVKEKATGNLLVLKKAHFGGTPEEAVQSMLTELRALTGVHHTNIVQFHRHIKVGEGMIGILMEYCPCGSLRLKIDENAVDRRHFPDDVVIKWLGQIASALQHVHDQQILHRDLKPDNIFMATNRSVKIGDFGLATFVATRSERVGGKAGTVLYAAPEILKDEEYSYRCDLWSLGVIMYEVISLNRPFRTSDEVQNGDYEPLPATVYIGLRSIVHSLLNKDPKQRPRGEDILKNEVIQNANLTVTYMSKTTVQPNVNNSFHLYPSLPGSTPSSAKLSSTSKPPPPKEFDLAFALDCTHSMQKYIDATKQGICQIVDEIKEKAKCSIRLALVEYRDHPPEDTTFVTKVFEFTEDEGSIKTELESCKADGGGDTPEAIADALCDLKTLEWRKSSTKVAVMVVDAPPHGLKGFEFRDGFPDGCPEGHDPVKLCDDLRAKDITLYFVGCEPSSASYRDIYDGLAYKTGGRYLPLKDTKQLVNLIISSSLQSISYSTMYEAVDSLVLKKREAGIDEETASREVVEEVKILGSKLSVLSTGGKRFPNVSEKARQFRFCKNLRDLNDKIRDLKSSHPDERPGSADEPPPEYRVLSADPSMEDVAERVKRSYRSSKK